MSLIKKTFPILCVFAFSCAVRPPLNTATPPASLAQYLPQDSIESVEGDGDIVLAFNGEEIAVTFDIRWKGDDAFGAQFYGPLGIPLATIKAITASRWAMSLGDTQYVEHPSKNIRIGRDFVEYPFPWAGLVSALTGRFPCMEDLRSRPDSAIVDDKRTVMLWMSRSLFGQAADISASIDNKTSRLTEISYKTGGTNPWSLTYSGFRDGCAKEIRFAQADNNYFYVKYHTLTIRTRKAIRQ